MSVQILYKALNYSFGADSRTDRGGTDACSLQDVGNVVHRGLSGSWSVGRPTLPACPPMFSRTYSEITELKVALVPL